MNKTAPTRAEAERRERRMKPGNVAVDGRKLLVNDEALDRDKYEYRFVADRGGRVQSLYGQDWDVVTDEQAKDESNSGASTRTVHGGTEESGKGYNMVLMRKHKDWFDEDQRRKQAPLEEVDKQLQRNQAQEIAAKTDADLAKNAYVPGSDVPGGGNKIEVSSGYKP